MRISDGAFIACSNYPECKFTRAFGPPSEDGDAAARSGRVAPGAVLALWTLIMLTWAGVTRFQAFGKAGFAGPCASDNKRESGKQENFVLD